MIKNLVFILSLCVFVTSCKKDFVDNEEGSLSSRNVNGEQKLFDAGGTDFIPIEIDGVTHLVSKLDGSYGSFTVYKENAATQQWETAFTLTNFSESSISGAYAIGNQIILIHRERYSIYQKSGSIYTKRYTVNYSQNSYNYFTSVIGVGDNYYVFDDVGYASFAAATNFSSHTRYYFGGAFSNITEINGLSHVATRNGVYISANGLSWQRVVTPSLTEFYLGSVSYNGNLVVLIGNSSSDAAQYVQFDNLFNRTDTIAEQYYNIGNSSSYRYNTLLLNNGFLLSIMHSVSSSGSVSNYGPVYASAQFGQSPVLAVANDALFGGSSFRNVNLIDNSIYTVSNSTIGISWYGSGRYFFKVTP